MSAQILLIEDEPGLVLTLTDRLQMHGYAVRSAQDGASGLEAALAGGFDLILLDVMLPRMSGFEVCRRLREAGDQTPLLMLTARDEVVDRVHGLRIGADDYLTKPFDLMELLARIDALLRRAGPSRTAPGGVARFGEIEVDFRRSEVRVKGQVVNLSLLEFQLLRYLLERQGETVSREELLERVWGMKQVLSSRTVDVHITWLRQKLEENPKYPRHIVTVRGLGYKLEM
jgi:two-component system, OmpR family, alkaline phosphatase synthesis response regulator PhoP